MLLLEESIHFTCYELIACELSWRLSQVSRALLLLLLQLLSHIFREIFFWEEFCGSWRKRKSSSLSGVLLSHAPNPLGLTCCHVCLRREAATTTPLNHENRGEYFYLQMFNYSADNCVILLCSKNSLR